MIKEKILVPPCAYQGGKQRVAKDIIDRMFMETKYDEDTQFYDLCCGSGAISLELVNRGIYPNNIHMVDKSPWGLFWKQIGDTTFSTEMFQNWINSVPKDVSKIQEYIKGLSQVHVYNTQLDISYIFLLLQASAFGSKSIWIENEKWQNCSFRNYWLPTETSSRRSPVNPMMPMPNTLLERTEELSLEMEGVNGYYDYIENINIKNNSIIYIDPPYDKTTKYGYEFDYMKFINTYKSKNIIFLSEGRKLSDNAYLISSGREKGGISGERKVAHEEWLNIFNE